MNIRARLIVICGLLLPALAGCVAANRTTTLEGVEFSNNLVGTPIGVDGVNTTVAVRKIPAIDRFGDPIVEYDPATGVYRPVFVDMETDLITDNPIGEELLLTVAQGGVDLGVSKILSDDGCKGNGCGGLTVVDTTNIVEVLSEVDLGVEVGDNKPSRRRVKQH
jgi:hypothetical protein